MTRYKLYIKQLIYIQLEIKYFYYFNNLFIK